MAALAGRGLPKRQVAAGLADHPLIDQGHEAGVFGGVEEFPGRDETLRGMLPAEQGLKADDLPGMHLENGLVEDAELSTVEGGAEIGFKLQAGDGAVVHSGIEEFGAASAHGLSATQSGFSVAEGIVGPFRLGRTESAADTDAGVDFALLEDEGSGDGGVNAFGYAEDVTGIGAGFEQDDELVASEAGEHGVRSGFLARAGDGVSGAEGSLQANPDFDQDLISSGGPHRVIEGLEGVDINQQQRVAEVRVPLRLREAALEAIEEEAAIRQSGERVVQGMVGELGFRLDAPGDIAVDDDQLFDFAALVLDGAGGGFENSPLAVFVTEAILQALAYAGSARFARGFEHLEAVVGMDLFEDRGLGQFLGRVAEDLFVGGTVVEAVTFGVDQRDHVGGIFGNDAEELFAIAGTTVSEVDPELLADDEEQQGNEDVGVPGGAGENRCAGDEWREHEFRRAFR